jgi:hypothetical protein
MGHWKELQTVLFPTIIGRSEAQHTRIENVEADIRMAGAQT